MPPYTGVMSPPSLHPLCCGCQLVAPARGCGQHWVEFQGGIAKVSSDSPADLVPVCLRRGVSYKETPREKQHALKALFPPLPGVLFPPEMYKVKSAGAKDGVRVVYKVKRPPTRTEAALPPAVSELPHGASVHQGPAKLPVSNENGVHP